MMGVVNVLKSIMENYLFEDVDDANIFEGFNVNLH